MKRRLTLRLLETRGAVVSTYAVDSHRRCEHAGMETITVVYFPVKCRRRGVDAFDIFDEICDRGLAKRLLESRCTEFVEDSDVPSRYGLRKVYKNEFDRDPERYVLRIGYPDFPECPFGETFSVLGFDTAEQTYVWLVTSILRDSRLNRIPYQGSEVPDNE